MKIIDLLNMIADKKIKEGTKIIHIDDDNEKTEYLYTRNDENEEESLDMYYCNEEGCQNYKYMPSTFFDDFYLADTLNDKVEVIAPDGTNIKERQKIKELEIDQFIIRDEFTGDYEFVGDMEATRILFDKINEVVRWIEKKQ